MQLSKDIRRLADVLRDNPEAPASQVAASLEALADRARELEAFGGRDGVVIPFPANRRHRGSPTNDGGGAA